jgi:ligand-binding sensor domain-containing protein
LRISYIIALFCLYLLPTIPVAAQHPYFYTINDENGLPSNEVYNLLQDKFGYMWIGCDAGLFRYDGFRYDRFSNKEQTSVAVSNLRQQNDSVIFAQNFSGQIFRVSNDSMTIFANLTTVARGLPEYTIDREGNIWIGVDTGIVKYAPDGTLLQFIENQHNFCALETQNSNESLIFASNSELQQITFGTGTNFKVKILNDSQHPDRRNLRHLVRTSEDRVIVHSIDNNSNVHQISEVVGNELKVIKTLGPAFIGLLIYTATSINGNIWLGTSNGAYLLDKHGEITNHYFKGKKISCIYHDREQNYWFASLQDGIFIIPQLDLVRLTTTNSALEDENITTVHAVSNNDVLFGTYTGAIYNYAVHTGKMTKLPMTPNTLYRNVTKIIPYNDDIVLAARGGLSIINTKKNSDFTYSAIYIRDMTLAGDSIIQISTQGVSCLSDVKKLIRSEKGTFQLLIPLPGKKICYDSLSQTAWVSLNDGLTEIHGNTRSRFLINGNPVFCNALYANKAGLWVGTVSDGLYNISHGKVNLHLSAANGLRGTNIKCITSQNDTLYIATDVGVNIRYPDGSFAYISHANGVNAREINAIAVSPGYIFIATIRGLFYIPANTRFRNTTPPNLRLTTITQNGTAINYKSGIHLHYNNKNLQINFSAVALKSRGEFSYRYRIIGFQNEWKYTEGKLNYVQLNYLPPGKYVFELSAANEDGVNARQYITLPITVSAPFWERWWFYVLIAILAATAVTLVFLLRIKAIRKQSNVRNMLTNSQLTALKAQMNPHFMYNTLNSIQDLVLQSDIKSTNYYLGRYSTLMRKILEISDDNEIVLDEEIAILQLYLELEQLRFGSDFVFNIHVAPGVSTATTYIPSLIIQPFVENAIKHGLLHKKGRKLLDIDFAIVSGNLVCTITDNGIGRKRSEEIRKRAPIPHKSFATKATEKRLSLININRKNKIVLTIIDLYEKDTATGTRVVVEIPLL